MANPKLTLIGVGGAEARNSTPTQCLTGSGVIFTCRLGWGLTCLHGEKIKCSWALRFDFNFSVIFETLKIKVSPTLILTCYIDTQILKN